MRRSPQPEHQQQRERGPQPARMPRFDTAPPEDDIYGQPPSRQPPPQDPYLGRGRTFSPPVFRRTSQNAPEDNRERQMSEFPAEIPLYRPSGDARIATAAPKTNIRPPTFAGRELENFSSWVWKMESYLRTIRVPPEDYDTRNKHDKQHRHDKHNKHDKPNKHNKYNKHNNHDNHDKRRWK